LTERALFQFDGTKPPHLNGFQSLFGIFAQPIEDTPERSKLFITAAIVSLLP